MIQKIFQKRKLKKEADEKLRQSLIEAVKMDEARLEEELKDLPPHQFSENFEKNMVKLMQKRSKQELFFSAEIIPVGIVHSQIGIKNPTVAELLN